VDVRRFADLFPRLENLQIRPDPNMCDEPLILRNDPFRTMSNMRVLKLDKVAVHSFEILNGGCMPHLEELYLRFADELDSLTRIESFPNFPKLAKLKLRLKRVKWIHPRAFDHLTQLIRFEIHCFELEDDMFETGATARSMSFHVLCALLKLTSNSVSQVEEIEMWNYIYERKSRLETVVPLSGLKKLTTSRWTNSDLPFHQMTNLEHVKLETSDLSFISSGELKCLAKLRVLEVKNIEKKPSTNSGNYLFKFKERLPHNDALLALFFSRDNL
jgi:hypothetical protein